MEKGQKLGLIGRCFLEVAGIALLLNILSCAAYTPGTQEYKAREARQAQLNQYYAHQRKLKEEERARKRAYSESTRKQREEEARRDVVNTWRFLSGGFLGAAAAGALDSSKHTSKQNIAARGFARGMLHQNRSQAIRDSGSNVAVYAGPLQARENIPEVGNYLGLPEAFFCEHYVEGESGSRRFKNLKNVFRINDNVQAISLWKIVNGDLNGKKVTLDILGIDTNKVIAYDCGEPENTIRGKNGWWFTHYELSASKIKENIGGNSFRGIWNLNGNPQKYTDLMIIDAEKKE